MRVEDTTVRKLNITQIPNLDPVSVIIEEYEVGQAKVIIQCWDRSWNYYWGSMGGNLKEFFTRTNVDYLTNKFATEMERQPQGLDYDAMQDDFRDKVRKRVLEMRFGHGIEKDTARTVYDEADSICLRDIAPEHTYDTWDLDHWSMCEKSWEQVFYSKDDFNEWCYDNIHDIYEPNREWNYLARIVKVVKEAVMDLEG